jgi:polyhydroxybutyrate depolymerase
MCPAWIVAVGLALAGCGEAPPSGSETNAGADPSTGTAAASTGEADPTGTSEGPASTDGPVEPEETSAGETDSGDGDGPAPCVAGLPHGRYTGLQLEVDGRTRSYDLFVPETVDLWEPTPLVLNFHGYLGSPPNQAAFSQFDAVATERGLVVAYPAGVGSSWNGGQCCGTAHEDQVDDVAFARALVDRIASQACIDRRRVGAIGMSNGGHLAHRLACQAADVFSIAVSVTGVLAFAGPACDPVRPISVVQFHGTSDAIVPYGGAGPGYPHVGDMMRDWGARNGCALQPSVTHEVGDARCETWAQCDDDVETTLCTVTGGGHCWFGNPDCPFGASTTQVDASAYAADLVLHKTLP